MRNLGVRSRHNEEFEKLEYHDDHIVTYLQSGKKIKSDIVLWANGRTGNTQELGLKKIGLTTNSRGQISVSGRYQTKVKNIYAAGDVIGWPSLAGAAYDQGRAASNVIVAPEECSPVEQVATGIYTIPEISTLAILGIHRFGDQASEIVHIGQAIMRQPGSANRMRYFLTTTFNYPTMAEAYRTAALDGLNRVF